MCLVTELCIASLDVYIGSGKKYNEAVAKGMPEWSEAMFTKMMRDTAAALAFMHSKTVIHRDLKVVHSWIHA